jgi:hypothetical protein
MSHEVLELSTNLAPTISANESKEGEPWATATTTVSIHHLESRMTQNQEGQNDEIMHMFAVSGVYIKMSPMASTFHDDRKTRLCCGLEDNFESRATQM